MSEFNSRLGLSHQLQPETEILHTTISGRKSLGRISDLILAWVGKRQQLELSLQTQVRILSQALIELAAPETKNDMGYFEFAMENSTIFISVRFGHSLEGVKASEGIDIFEREVTQFWMKSPRSSSIRRNLGAHDRVEVRHHSSLNVTEWRLITNMDQRPTGAVKAGFAVFLDGTEKIESVHGKITDLGDLPYENLLNEVYRSGGAKAPSRSGEVRFQGQAVHEEDEAARIQFEKELDEIDSEIEIPVSAEAEKKNVDSYLEELVARLRTEQVEIKDQAKDAIREAKAKELAAQRQAATFEQKIKKFEDLLKRKELLNVKNQNQIKVLSEKVNELSKKAGNDAQAKAFRDKALQMHAMVKKVIEDKEVLEKALNEYRAKEKASANEAATDHKPVQQSNGLQLEEVTKKADRLQRALEAEKVKVKQLSERVIVAEKESQAAGPMVKDLEARIEQAVKLTQQAKKETETVKQKVVQAEQEKNKVQNELVKVQAQIATLQKRQAA